ncbi:type II toxin-antitoxin system VapC family toxin [uncultured Sphingomonas sp.]|uniref:type II toxin-antitoxin system VapC family toxin n=1 Tax=uncultured Sphingomonas sp. TaxID=158754 RepID=UPI0035CB92BD
MRLLLDTHLLLWIAEGSARLSKMARALINDDGNVLMFSAVSIAEVSIKHALRRPDFTANPAGLRRGLTDNGYVELPLTSDHAVAVGALPPIHTDPFDRLLLAQAMAEGIVLLTGDAVLAEYPGPVRVV